MGEWRKGGRTMGGPGKGEEEGKARWEGRIEEGERGNNTVVS